MGALLVVPHASNGAFARSVLLYRGFSWGLWVLGGALALLHLRSATPDGATPTAAAVEADGHQGARSSAGGRASRGSRGSAALDSELRQRFGRLRGHEANRS